MPDAASIATDAGAALMAVAAILCASATVAALAPRSNLNPRGLSLALSAIACAALLALGLVILATGVPATASLGDVLSFHLVDVRFDTLSALFLVALGIVGTASSVFGIGYGAGAHGAAEGDRTAAAYPVFLASLALVFGASDAFAFLFAWGDFLFASTLNLGAQDATPISVALYNFIGAGVNTTSWNSVMATAVLASAPAAVLLVAAQRYIAAGVTSGAVKD